MEYITEYLSEIQQKYNNIITGTGSDADRLKKLREICEEIDRQAQIYIEASEREIYANNRYQEVYQNERAALYEQCKKDTALLSDLDAERIKLSAGIMNLRNEIEESRKSISDLICEQEKKKKDRDYWETVWWSTCWIPFANIGTGIKWENEDNQYKARVRQIQDNIAHKQQRIKELNDKLQEISLQQEKNKESSRETANKITAINGEISRVTEQINQARKEITTLRMIESVNMEINAIAEFSNDSVRIIKETIERLNNLRNRMQSTLMTTKYVHDCISRGDRLLAGEILSRNECLLSNNKRFAAIMQSDNNFVVYNSERPLWSSKTWTAAGNGRIVFDAKGNIYLEGTSMQWDTKREGATVLIMQDDGNLVAYKENHEPVWSSDTYTYAQEPSICFSVPSAM